MLRSKIVTMQQTETELRGQLTLYVEKFRQVEETLNRSNELFANFRKEMEQVRCPSLPCPEGPPTDEIIHRCRRRPRS
jgi:hypothetical protein